MTNSPSLPDTWALGSAYEPYVGRWSRLVAREFINWLAIRYNSRWLDVGSGTGALTQTILQHAQPSRVRGLDRSDGFVAHARQHTPDPRASFDVADAQALPDPDETYDAVVSGLVLNFVPQPSLAVREMARVARPGGTVAIYVWDYAGEMQFMRRFWDAASALDPAIASLDEGLRFPLCQPGPLAGLFGEAGLTGVEGQAIDIPTVFRDFDDFWQPFLGGQGSAPTYLMSLSEGRRLAIRERLDASLPREGNGAIALMARAWAVKGRK
jgi:SAM-dependent methyltransferase